jgi:hypothetical protein
MSRRASADEQILMNVHNAITSAQTLHGHQAGAPDAPTAGGRKHHNMGLQEERWFWAPFLQSAAGGGVLVVDPIKAALDKRLGRAVPLASVYNLLHRHHWRQLVPDKHYPQRDPLAQDGWGENSPKHSPAKTGGKTRFGMTQGTILPL